RGGARAGVVVRAPAVRCADERVLAAARARPGRRDAEPRAEQVGQVRLAGEAGRERDLGERLVAVEDAGEGVAQAELAAEAVDGVTGGGAEHAAGVKHR